MKEDIAIWKMSRDLVAVKDLKSWRHISRKSVKCVTILETSALIMNIIMKLIFGIYMKNSYFFHISLNIGRSDMKQTAKNSVRSMLSYPFTLFWILTHTFFFFFWCYHFLMLPLCLVSLLIDSYTPYTKVHTPRLLEVHTPRSIHQATRVQMSIHLPIFI